MLYSYQLQVPCKCLVSDLDTQACALQRPGRVPTTQQTAIPWQMLAAVLDDCGCAGGPDMVHGSAGVCAVRQLASAGAQVLARGAWARGPAPVQGAKVRCMGLPTGCTGASQSTSQWEGEAALVADHSFHARCEHQGVVGGALGWEWEQKNSCCKNLIRTTGWWVTAAA